MLQSFGTTHSGLDDMIVSGQRNIVAAWLDIYDNSQSQTARCLHDRSRRSLAVMNELSASILAYETLQPLFKMPQIIQRLCGLLNTATYLSEHT